jgi:hypothetical protein
MGSIARRKERVVVMDEWLSFQISCLAEDAGESKTPITFPFAADDVETIYTLKFGDDGDDEAGDGLWFRLKDGRMFNGLGKPDKTPSPVLNGLTMPRKQVMLPPWS